MTWRHATWRVEHRLPLGVTERATVGDTAHAGGVLASGTQAGVARKVSGARHVGVHPADLAQVVRVPVGAEVARGTVLARTGKRFARAATSPIDGRVVHLSAEGDFYIAPIVDRWVLHSTMDGTVVASSESAIVVEGAAWCLPGIAAYGPDAVGELALGVDAPMDELAPGRIDVRLRDRILVGGARIAAEAITRAHACGVAGLVAGAAPAAGLRVVYGDDVAATGLATREDRPTVLCLSGFGSAPMPREVFGPLVAFVGQRAAVHVASARLFVFAAADAIEATTDTPALVLADDYGGVRPLEGTSVLGPSTRFASEVRADAMLIDGGAVPLANVRAFDAPR